MIHYTIKRKEHNNHYMVTHDGVISKYITTDREAAYSTLEELKKNYEGFNDYAVYANYTS